MSDITSIGGVLAYRSAGIMRAGGQTIGADGAGQFAVIIVGTPEVAELRAQQYVKQLEAIGHKLAYVIFAANGEDWGYAGNSCSIIYDTQGAAEVATK